MEVKFKTNLMKKLLTISIILILLSSCYGPGNSGDNAVNNKPDMITIQNINNKDGTPDGLCWYYIQTNGIGGKCNMVC